MPCVFGPLSPPSLRLFSAPIPSYSRPPSSPHFSPLSPRALSQGKLAVNQWLTLDLGAQRATHTPLRALRVVCGVQDAVTDANTTTGKHVPAGCPMVFSVLGSHDNVQYQVKGRVVSGYCCVLCTVPPPLTPSLPSPPLLSRMYTTYKSPPSAKMQILHQRTCLVTCNDCQPVVQRSLTSTVQNS